MKGLKLLGRRPSIGSLLVTDEFSLDEMHQFWMNSQNILVSKVSGSENFSGKFLKPSFNNTLLSSEILDLMVEYYLAIYVLFGFWKPFSEGSDDDIVIRIKMNQFGRCRIGSEVFGSSISIRHAKSSLQKMETLIIIQAKFNIILLIQLTCRMVLLSIF